GYSCAYMNTLSWRSPTTPLPVETNPRKVFRRLFGQGDSQEQRLGQLRDDHSMLDSVLRDLGRLQRTLGPADNHRVSEYLESIRDVERRFQRRKPARPLAAADSGGGRRRREAEGRRAPGVPEGHADDEPADDRSRHRGCSRE